MSRFHELLKNVISTKAYAMPRTMEEDPLMGFMFQVSISGIDSKIGFQKVGGLSKEIAVVNYFENMYQHAHKLPGRESIGEITFERGMYADDAFQIAYEEFFKSISIAKLDLLSLVNPSSESTPILLFAKLNEEFCKIRLCPLI